MSQLQSGSLPREVFLSHASPDRRSADALATTLRGHGVPVWYSQTNLLGAQQWYQEIGKALNRCDWFIVLCSEEALKSVWVERELMFALLTPRFAGRIMPVMVDGCAWQTVWWGLVGYQNIDLAVSYDDGCRALLRSWGIGLDASRIARPETQPP